MIALATILISIVNSSILYLKGDTEAMNQMSLKIKTEKLLKQRKVKILNQKMALNC